MRIEVILCSDDTAWHIWWRHQVLDWEVDEAAYRHGLVVRGRGKNVYEVYGRTDAGRYLMIAVRYLGRGAARVITARDMSESERRRYRKYVAH